MSELQNDSMIELINEGLSSRIPNEIFSIYLTGSRLYGFETEDSDYDLKVYVKPTFEDIALNRMVSKQMKLENQMIDGVDIKDIRYQYKELTKPSFGSLHLLTYPIYGECLTDAWNIEQLFNNGKRNLVLSMLGTFRSRQNKDTNKDRAHLSFLLETATIFFDHEVNFDFFNNEPGGTIAEISRDIRNGSDFYDCSDFINRADELFDIAVKSNPDKQGKPEEILLRTIVTEMKSLSR